MGCLGRLGCLVVLLVGGAVGVWLYGDRLPSLVSRTVEQTVERAADGVARTAERVGEQLDRPASERIDASEPADSARREEVPETSRERSRTISDEPSGDRRSWVPLSQKGTGAGDPLGALRGSNAPAYVTLQVGQVATLLAPLRAALPPTAIAPAIAVEDDRLLLRAVVARRDFAGGGALGALIGATLDGVDTLLFAGRFEPVRPGLVQFRIQALTVGPIDIPSRLIPPIARKVRRHLATSVDRLKTDRRRPDAGDGIAEDALPVPLPALVSDIRVVNGRFTVYRNVTGGSR